MKTAVKETTFEHSTVESSSVFKIKESGKAFRILIDGIYSDKIPSCVRELSTNAFDSHIAAKNSAAFYVHCPTDLNPEFYVRDYGVGMDHEKVMGLYSTMFDSDKTGDNSQAGMFGLGSKTPFAYTDQFHITCYDGKESRLYIAGIGVTGVPEIHCFETQECDEPRGVKVGFSVTYKDFAEFKKAAGKIRLGFPYPFESNMTFSETLGAPVLMGKGWTSYQHKSVLSSNWMVRQGCVLYPIVAHAGLDIPYDGSRCYIIDCPIGTIEVTTAREAIAYTPAVVEYIAKRIARIKQDARDIVWQKVKDIKNCADFFAEVASSKPGFVDGNFQHKPTGLDAPVLRITAPSCHYTASKQYDGRWSYNEGHQLSAQKSKREDSGYKGTYPGTSRPIDNTIYVIRDISAFLDQSRAPLSGSFSQNETRRVARHIRRWMEKENRDVQEFLLGIDKSDDFWENFAPHYNRVSLTTKEILSLVPPCKTKAAAPTYVRGVSLSIKGSERGVIEKIDPSLNCAWVTAEFSQQQSPAISRIAGKFGIDHIYVATASAVKKIEEAKVPSLLEKVESVIKDKYGLSLHAFVQQVKFEGASDHHIDYLRNFGNSLLKAGKKDSVLSLSRARTSIAPIFKTLLTEKEKKKEPLLTSAEVASLTIIVGGSGWGKIPDNAEHKEFNALANLLGKNSNHPAVRFVGSLSYVNAPYMVTTAEALNILFKTIPLT